MKDLELIFKALSDKNRIRIIQLLSKRRYCACRLLELLDISQSTLSHHLKVLEEAGLVSVTRCGRKAHYCIDDSGIEKIEAFLKDINF